MQPLNFYEKKNPPLNKLANSELSSALLNSDITRAVSAVYLWRDRDIDVFTPASYYLKAV